MIKKTVSDILVEITASPGCMICREGEKPTAGNTFSSIMVPESAISEFAEVSEVSVCPYTEERYASEVSALVRRRYTASDEAAMQRKMINAITAGKEPDQKTRTEFDEYNAFVEDCKIEARHILADRIEADELI